MAQQPQTYLALNDENPTVKQEAEKEDTHSRVICGQGLARNCRARRLDGKFVNTLQIECLLVKLAPEEKKDGSHKQVIHDHSDLCSEHGDGLRFKSLGKVKFIHNTQKATYLESKTVMKKSFPDITFIGSNAEKECPDKQNCLFGLCSAVHPHSDSCKEGVTGLGLIKRGEWAMEWAELEKEQEDVRLKLFRDCEKCAQKDYATLIKEFKPDPHCYKSVQTKGVGDCVVHSINNVVGKLLLANGSLLPWIHPERVLVQKKVGLRRRDSTKKENEAAKTKMIEDHGKSSVTKKVESSKDGKLQLIGYGGYDRAVTDQFFDDVDIRYDWVSWFPDDKDKMTVERLLDQVKEKEAEEGFAGFRLSYQSSFGLGGQGRHIVAIKRITLQDAKESKNDNAVDEKDDNAKAQQQTSKYIFIQSWKGSKHAPKVGDLECMAEFLMRAFVETKHHRKDVQYVFIKKGGVAEMVNFHESMEDNQVDEFWKCFKKNLDNPPINLNKLEIVDKCLEPYQQKNTNKAKYVHYGQRSPGFERMEEYRRESIPSSSGGGSVVNGHGVGHIPLDGYNDIFVDVSLIVIALATVGGLAIRCFMCSFSVVTAIQQRYGAQTAHRIQAVQSENRGIRPFPFRFGFDQLDQDGDHDDQADKSLV